MPLSCRVNPRGRGAARIAGRKLVQGLAHWFEVWNKAGENAFRLATFMAMQESGKTVAESASMAKNSG